MIKYTRGVFITFSVTFSIFFRGVWRSKINLISGVTGGSNLDKIRGGWYLAMWKIRGLWGPRGANFLGGWGCKNCCRPWGGAEFFWNCPYSGFCLGSFHLQKFFFLNQLYPWPPYAKRVVSCTNQQKQQHLHVWTHFVGCVDSNVSTQLVDSQ